MLLIKYEAEKKSGQIYLTALF